MLTPFIKENDGRILVANGTLVELQISENLHNGYVRRNTKDAVLYSVIPPIIDMLTEPYVLFGMDVFASRNSKVVDMRHSKDYFTIPKSDGFFRWATPTSLVRYTECNTQGTVMKSPIAMLDTEVTFILRPPKKK